MTREEALAYAISQKAGLESELHRTPCGYGNWAVYSTVLDFINAAISALKGPTREQVENRELLSIEELNLKPGEYAVCLARRNPFSEWYPMVIKRVRNGYVSPVMEQYVTDILGGFRIPDLKKAKEAKP